MVDEARRFLVVADCVVTAGLQHQAAPLDGVTDGDDRTAEAWPQASCQREARRGDLPVDGRDDDQVEEGQVIQRHDLVDLPARADNVHLGLVRDQPQRAIQA